LLLGRRLEALPRKRATDKVKKNVSEGFHVIPTGLFDSEMGVDGGISSSSGQVLVLSVGDVKVGLGVTVLLGKPEIDDVDLVATLSNAHQEVIRLDITVDEGLGVNIFDPGDELIGQEKGGLEGELSVAKVEQILKAGSEEIENHSIVVTFGSEPTDEGDTDTASERFVDTSLIFELGVLGFDALKLDGDFLARNDVGAEIDITKGTTSDLPSDTVLVSYPKIHSVESTEYRNVC